MTAATDTAAEAIFADPTQNAKLDMLLVTESGMRSKTKARVSVAQWGAICIAVNSHADALVCLAGSELLEALVEAADWFEGDANEHYAMAKIAPDCREQHSREVKGKLNRDRATQLRAAIAKATGQ
ncbi:MAG: hypothetical protein V4523_08005 [Pseudomonadota bacterium]